MDKRVKVIWKSLFITLLIFGFAVLFNHFLDFLRLGVITDVMAEHELDRDAYLTQQTFIETFSEYGCSALKVRFNTLKEEIRKVGTELNTYSRFSFFKRKDFDYLKRKYFLLEFEFLTLVQKINEMCGKPYLLVLFFYEIDDEASERQGFILEEVRKKFEDKIVVLSIDKDYKDEPLVSAIIRVFNVTDAPALIVDGDKIEDTVYSDELESIFKKALSSVDFFGKKKNLDFTVRATYTNMSSLIEDYEAALLDEADPFARADLLLLLGRLEKNNVLICSALKEFDKVDLSNHEEKALAYETIASIGCGRNKAKFYNLAAEEWEKIGKQWRADIDYLLADGDMPQLKFNITFVSPDLKEGDYSSVTIGNSEFFVDELTTVVSQVDRVSRDWLSGQIQSPFSENILKVFSELKSWKKPDVMESVGWHEGGRVRDLLKTGAGHDVAAGTMVAEKDGKWYAPDETGVFRFEVPIDKLLYPTTRFLRDNLAVIIDTHGINMLVDQAISHNATLVIGCGDHPAKAAAAKYLSDKGIDVISFPNKFFHLLLNDDKPVRIMGSPPFEDYLDHIRIGHRPLKLSLDDRIVVSNSSNDLFSLWYYQSPAHYFSELQKVIPLDITYYSLKDFKDQLNLVAAARKIDANIIATRIYNQFDYGALSEWLREDKRHKAVLFHSSSYPYGVKLFKEFPKQTSFGDVNVVLE